MERPGTARAFGPPLGALAAARLVAWLAAWTHGFDPVHSDTWVRWDSLWYLRIANEGYSLVPCRLPNVASTDLFCGTTGWFPGYPALIWLVSRLGVPPPDAGYALSLLAQEALLFILWNGFFEARWNAKNALALGLAAFFPGLIYAQAVFPIALFLALATGFWWCASHGRMPAAAGLGAAAAFTYPTGFLLAVGYGAWLIWGRAEKRDGRALLPLAGVAAGFAAVLGVMGAQTGRWDAFFRTQAGYGYGLSNPFQTLASRVSPLFRQAAPAIDRVTACQTLWALAFVALVIAHLVQGPRTGLTVLAGATVVAYWLFPLMLGGSLSLYRAEGLLFPGVLVLREGRKEVLAGAALTALALAWPMAVGFLEARLV